MSDFIDIGFGVSIAFAEYEGKVVGLHERHPSKKDPSQPCCGFVWFDVETEARCEGTPVWQVECMDPLTLSPSHPLSCVAGAATMGSSAKDVGYQPSC